MTSASVNNAGLDASIIPAAVKTVSSQNMQKGQDFGKIMDQAAGKTKKDNTFEVKQEVKADTSKPKKTDKSLLQIITQCRKNRSRNRFRKRQLWMKM